MENAVPLVLTVGQLTNYMKSAMDSDPHLKNILLTGEISNFTLARSGHMYLTLKDDTAAMRAVMFRRSASFLKFRPEDGMKVIVSGHVSIYPKNGEYQFYIDTMQPDGLGALSLAFEQLKKKLEREGLFDEKHKKVLPDYPQKIGVVTSPSTAAFQDIQKVLRRRWPLAEITLCPALVQGDEAPAQIVSALKTIDRAGMDVIILARGGGSIEDLWCFNDERVARAVYDCKTPVVTGVGHETDTTLVDFVADQREPTPSAAAERVSPDQNEEYDRILQCQNRMRSILQNRINNDRDRIEYWKTSNALSGFPSLLDNRRVSVDDMLTRLSRSLGDKLSQEENKVWMYQGKLETHKPRNLLLRYQGRLDKAESRLSQYIAGKMNQERSRLKVSAAKLVAYNPLQVLSRGYSIANKEDGTVIKSADQLSQGETFTLQLSDGTARCTAEDIQKEEH